MFTILWSFLSPHLPNALKNLDLIHSIKHFFFYLINQITDKWLKKCNHLLSSLSCIDLFNVPVYPASLPSFHSTTNHPYFVSPLSASTAIFISSHSQFNYLFFKLIHSVRKWSMENGEKLFCELLYVKYILF